MAKGPFKKVNPFAKKVSKNPNKMTKRVSTRTSGKKSGGVK